MQTDTALPSESTRLPESGRARSRLLERLRVGLFEPVDIASIVFLRVAFGAVMLWEVYRHFKYGWISRYYIEPTVYYTYYGFGWVRPWPGEWMYAHFYVLGLLAACIMVGFCYRAAAALFFLGFAYVFLLDQTQYLNHFYLICLMSFLLVFVPAHRALSLDAWLRPKLRSQWAPAWALWLLRAQIGLVYFFGGVAKLNHDWLRGEPMRMWLARGAQIPVFGFLFTKELTVYLFVFGGLMLDLCVVPLLLWKRTRPYAFAAAVTFHLINAGIFQIGIFPWFMLAATLIFFPPDLPRRFAHMLLHPADVPYKPLERAGEDALPPGELSRGRRALVVFLAVYMAFQILMPLRHFLYPGEVSWTEEGHQFSWHMKLRDKTATAVFNLRDPASGRTWTVDLRQCKTRQCDKMAGQPDMIIQFAHHLAEEKRREGYPDVEVRATVSASMNGRRPQLLIDPEVNLAKVRRSMWPASWIVPLTEPLPAPGAEQPGEITDEE
ncbi:MAG TPA: HTTM domain-containing protein [Pyrinomonadaceae bacterium]|nr:HTTM domain-containing protein [Pyrinomonadaceae bacterium]